MQVTVFIRTRPRIAVSHLLVHVSTFVAVLTKSLHSKVSQEVTKWRMTQIYWLTLVSKRFTRFRLILNVCT